MKWTLTLVAVLGLLCPALAQDTQLRPLAVGDQMPDIPFRNIRNYPTAASVADFRGKVVILDFWSTGCSACIGAFPKMEALQQKFPGQLQVILVNPHESAEVVEARTRRMYQYKPGVGLSVLPQVTGDTIWKRLFPHRTVPHHVWIGPDGKVAAITHGHNATPENVQQLLKNQLPPLAEKKDLSLTGYHIIQGLIRTTHSDLKTVGYSALTHYLPNSSGGRSNKVDTASGTRQISLYNYAVPRLFLDAFQPADAKDKLRFIIESDKKAQLLPPEDKNLLDKWRIPHVFSYEIVTPLVTDDELHRYMQEDLNRYFGQLWGIEARIEHRKMSCYVLVQKDKSKLPPSDTSKPYVAFRTDSTQVFQQCVFPDISKRLRLLLENLETPLAFIDDTDMAHNYMVRTSMIIALGKRSDQLPEARRLQALRKSLQTYGLDIKKQKRRIPVLVIRDK
ncbi:TlpA family protein disulfide reductase [Chitinophaga cymbidii]